MGKISQLTFAATIAGFALAGTQAAAAVITFDSLTGSNGDTFTSTSESGFDITATGGNWFEAHLNGAPVPSIFGNSDLGEITLTRTGGGLFTFQGADFDDATGGTLPWSIAGLLNGVSVFSTDGFASEQFETFDSTSGDSVFDTLVFTLDGTGTSSYNIDNIRVTEALAAVPLPASAALMLLGLAGIGAASRRKG